MHIIQSPYFLSDTQNKVPSLAAKDWEILQLIFYSPAPPLFFFYQNSPTTHYSCKWKLFQNLRTKQIYKLFGRKRTLLLKLNLQMKVKKYERQWASVNIKQTKNELINLVQKLNV